MLCNLALLLSTAAAAVSAQTPNYFLRFIGGNNVTNNAILHRNWTTPDVSPIAIPEPANPADHYYRFDPAPTLSNTNHTTGNETAGSPLLTSGKLLVIPTQPHPGPVSVWLSLSYGTNVKEAWRMTTSSYPETNEMVFDGWTAVADGEGRALLRYADATDAHRWIAVKTNTTDGYTGWAPWWVAPSAENYKILESWEWVLVDVELIEATGLVNSSAPFGTN